MRAQATNTVRRARRIILCLWTAGIVYCSPWLLLSTTMSKRLDDGRSISTCTFTLPRHQYLIYYMADLIIFYAVPLLTATVLYGLIARTLYAAINGPTPVDGRCSTRSTGDGIGAGEEASRSGASRLCRSGAGGTCKRRSTFLRQQSSISMSSANASTSRIQVCCQRQTFSGLVRDNIVSANEYVVSGRKEIQPKRCVVTRSDIIISGRSFHKFAPETKKTLLTVAMINRNVLLLILTNVRLKI